MDADNLQLSGVGAATGGTYHRVEMQGVSRIHGDVTCLDCKVEGVSEIHGHVRASTIDVRGKSKVYGSIEASRVAVEGSSLVDGDCRASLMNIRGDVRIHGDVAAQELDVHGRVIVKGSCDAEAFVCDGAFQIEQMLNADTIDVRLARSSKVQEIGCTTIQVKRSSIGRFGPRKSRLSVDVIEGDDIVLEWTRANVVRGNRVVLGMGADVELVEYQSDLILEGNARVRTKRQVNHSGASETKMEMIETADELQSATRNEDQI